MAEREPGDERGFTLDELARVVAESDKIIAESKKRSDDRSAFAEEPIEKARPMSHGDAVDSLARVAKRLFGDSEALRSQPLTASTLEDFLVNEVQKNAYVERLATAEWKQKYEKLKKTAKQFADACDAHSEARAAEYIARDTASDLGNVKILARLKLEEELEER